MKKKKNEKEREGAKSEIDRLPEECLSHILSFTSASDAVRATIVSPAFRAAANSNITWSRFLPSKYLDILTRAVNPVAYASCKELYFLLCDPLPIDGGTKIFSLEKKSGAISIIISAKEFGIVNIEDERYWYWTSDEEYDSRFTEVANQDQVRWLEFNCSIECGQFSPKTRYRSYLIYKTGKRAFGLKQHAQEVSVRLGTQISQGKVCVNPEEEDWEDNEIPPEARLPQLRPDGWMEIELGDIFNDCDSEEHIVMSFKHFNPRRCGGLMIEGIQVRPA